MRRVRDLLAIAGGGGLLFAAYSTYTGNEKFFQNVLMPGMHVFEAERMHEVAVKCVSYNIFRKQTTPDSPVLKTQVFGHHFANPIGMAAGFDKQGEAVDGLLKLGFGFVEVGSVTPEPQPGNPKPRVFRLMEDRAVINRYGFNSDGHDVVLKRLTDREKSRFKADGGIVGVNLGKNRNSQQPAGDYIKGVAEFSPHADYLVVNVSSPNTPGLREMQGRQQLYDLMCKVTEVHSKLPESTRPPILVKIGPDLTRKDKEDIAAVITDKKCGVQGLIVSNTTIRREDELRSKHRSEPGGLSGAPLREISTNCIHEMYFLTQGKVPIIGVGGVSCGQDAYDKILAGASLVQIYTSFIFSGPPVLEKIKRELTELLERDGFTSVSSAVGYEHAHPTESSS